MPTVLEIVRGALSEIGVLAAGATPDGADGQDALGVFNDFLDSLGVERLAMFTVLRTTKTLAASTASYTIGSGGDIDIVRPTWIDSARLVIDTSASTPTEIPLAVLTPAEYAAIGQKTLEASQPGAVYYDHAWSAGLGRVYVLPIPDVGTTQLVLYTPAEPIAQVSSLATSITLPPGLRRMLRKNLALELAPSYPGAVVSGLLVKQAAESKAAYEKANEQPIPLACDPAITGGRGVSWSIETDAYRR